ncbi:MAG TPA: hypothetical protein VFA56_04090, partial [Gaiellaceae bacterium]|nr:hypothetical protein [Gaiellaceae bacterium]
MKGFFNRGGDKELERRLRDERPEPRPEFLAMLTERIESRRPRRRTSVRTRVALVGAVTAALLIATSAVGGLAYAGTALKTVVVTAKTVVTAPVVSFKSHELSDKSAKVSNTQQGHGNDNKGNTQEQVGHG